jgi:hypothetical protein
MTQDLELIDQEIERLQQLRNLAQDPHMMEWMRKLVRTEPTAQPAALLYRGTASQGVGLTEGCRNAVARLDGEFTIHDVSRELNSDGVKIGAAKPMIAISGTLQRFVAIGLIEIIEVGKAGKPSRYRRKPQQIEMGV